MEDKFVSVAEFARLRNVSHEAVRKAIKVKRLAKSVVFSAAGKPRLLSRYTNTV